jgi:nicotinamidase/pyrazinamidase
MTDIQLPAKSRIASLDIHAQQTFTPLCPAELPVPEGHLIAEELNAQAALASKRLGAKEAHHPDAVWVATAEHPQLSEITGENVDVRWRPHSIVGSRGFELIPGLPRITEYDYYVWQGVELDMHPYGVCYHDLAGKLSTGIIEYLHDRQLDTVIVGGLATDYCVKTSVLQLLAAGFYVIVNLGACRGLAPETTTEAIAAMREHGAKLVDSSKQLIEKINRE